jgi:Flp pilus assembly protein TadG
MLDEEGSTVVEVALTLGILLMVVIGMFQMLLAVYTYHSLSEIAREATRYAIVRGANCINLAGCNADNTTIQTYAQGLAYPGIVSGSITTKTNWYTVTMDTTPTIPTAVLTACGSGTPPPGCNNPGNQVQVQVQYQFPVNIPFLSSTTINMSSTSAMVISQ